MHDMDCWWVVACPRMVDDNGAMFDRGLVS